MPANFTILKKIANFIVAKSKHIVLSSKQPKQYDE